MSDFEPTPEQEDVISSPDSSLIIAGPGTGKTRTAIEMALIAVGSLAELPNRQVLFLSFSNASVLRLAEAATLHIAPQQRRRLRFTTYHALAAELLRKYGRFCGLPIRTRIVDKLEERLLALDESWPEADDAYASRLREVAAERGLLTFDVLVPLARSLLESAPSLAAILGRRYPLIIVDEFQDTSQPQWELLRALGGSSQVVAFGDPNQIIYSGLHDATAKRMEDFVEWKGIEVSRFSAKNFRCGSPNILDFAESLLNGTPYTASGGGVGCRRIGYRKELRSYLALLWKNIREKVGEDQTIGFLAPNNSASEDIAVALRAPPVGASVSFPVYARMARDDAAHDAVLLAVAAVRDFALARDEKACHLAAVALIAMDLSWNSRKKLKLDKVRRVGSQLEKELGKNSPLAEVVAKVEEGQRISDLVPEFVTAIGDITEFKTSVKKMLAHDRIHVDQVASSGAQLPLFGQLRETREPKGLLGDHAAPGSTHVLNYHRAKGREFDFVAMVVDPRCESNKVALDEMRRLYYVCATRARKGLQVYYYPNELGRVLGPVLRPAAGSV